MIGGGAAAVVPAGANIYLLRHGETEWNVAGRFQGRLDSPLTVKGIAQAQACGRQLAALPGEVDVLFASPLGRTRRTADIVRAFRAYPDTRWDSRLAEVSIGAWDGLTHVDIEAGWPGVLDGSSPHDWFFRAPDGEGYDRAMARVHDWLRDAAGTVIAISHGLLGRLIRGAYLGLDRERTLALPVPQDVVWHLAEGRIAPFQASSG